MRRVWPQLEGYRITHAWKGDVALTFDAVPHMGTWDGVHYAMGCNGSGVAMMTWRPALHRSRKDARRHP